jgi:hypothetical protein
LPTGCDRNGKPLGTDFSNVYAAGARTLEGRPGDAYDPVLQHAWVMPLVARGVMRATGVPVGLIILVALYAMTLHRAARDSRAREIEMRRLASA